ncbi:hypothetical protein CALCODRAFT_493707 [Calocera cornea HHB12733]|uniref:Uncharacterized protein n=1 Tax=Calocera cornea HHB12733 TaxID=1353952 RepID=A0A165HJB7_9BASI|nr:hypothetical protein CALCODRAFT_493707 [Calocera cornea HHB12733]
MGGNQHPTERAALLSHAIDLCTSLRDTLQRLGPSRLTRSPDGLVPDVFATIFQVHELESTLHRRLQELEEKRNDALSPLSRLPDDILRLIFQEGHDSQLLEHRIFALGSGFSRLVSRVSRRWRAIALDTASLWTYVRFANPKYLADDDSDPIHPWYGSAKALSTMYICNLDRSKHALLNVDMHLPALPGAQTMVQEYLRTCHDRVAELILSVHTSNSDSLSAVVPCVDRTAGVLRRLRLSLVHTVSDVDARVTVEQLLALNLPQLEDVELHSVPLPRMYQPDYTGLLSCRRLHLTLNRGSQFSPARLLALLRCTPALEDLHMMLLPQPDLNPPAADERLLLPELRRIKCTTTSVSPHLPFAQLVAPKLERLGVDVLSRLQNPGQSEDYVADVLGFLEASTAVDGQHPPLRTLGIKGGIMGSLDRILPHLPDLETLQLVFERQWSAVDEADYIGLIEQLSKPQPVRWTRTTSIREPTYGWLCPKLQALESLAWATPTHIRPLTELAAKRRAAGLKIGRVKMVDWPGQWVSATQGGAGMPDGPEGQYELERALAREVGSLECGQYRWDWAGAEAQDATGGSWRRVWRTGDAG